MYSSILILVVSCATVLAGYADPAQGNAESGSSSNAGNGVDGSGYGYGFAGSTQGGNVGGGFGNFPQPPVFDFNSFLNAYFDSLRNYHEQFQSNTNSYAYTSNDLNSRAEAQASIVFDENYIGSGFPSNSLQAAHQGAVSGYGFPGGFPAFAGAGGAPNQPGAGAGAGPVNFAGGFGGSFPGSPETGGAAASAGIGPGGGFQSAAVYPENPNSPNVFNRFGETGGENQGQPGPGGFYGVFTSSHSSSSDVDGKKTQVHEAQTTVNDNGKVTTYKVKNP